MSNIEQSADGVSPGLSGPPGLFNALRSTRRMVGFCCLAFVFVITLSYLTDPDFWWHLQTGQYIVANRAIPRADIFSHTFAGKLWVTHEWLTEVIIYAVFRVAGLGGLTLFFSLIITVALWLVYRRCARHAPHPFVAGAATILAALAVAPFRGVRPQMLALLLTSLWVALLENYLREANRRALWWLPPLMLLWANLHGSFALGLALIAIYGAGAALDGWHAGDSRREVWRKLRPLALAGVVCAALVAVNPSGLKLYAYPLETLRSPAMQKFIEEWFSPNFHLGHAQPFAALLLLLLAFLALSPQRPRLSEILLLAVAVYAALRSWRNVSLLAVVAAPLLAEHAWHWLTAQSWGRWLAKPEPPAAGREVKIKILLNVLLLVAQGGALAVRFVHVLRGQAAAEAQTFPVAALAAMQQHNLPGPLFNEYGWGGYIIWRYYPQRPVYIDGRADVYGDEFLREYVKTANGVKGWRDPLERYGVNTILIKPDGPLASLLRQDKDWRLVYEDQGAALFTRPAAMAIQFKKKNFRS
jgi:hypothetical protein